MVVTCGGTTVVLVVLAVVVPYIVLLRLRPAQDLVSLTTATGDQLIEVLVYCT